MKHDSENELETALRRAADEPATRPDFYRLLVESQVFILGKSDSASEGDSMIPAGSNLAIVNWQRQDGSPVIPFFTSLSALQRAIEEEQPYVALPARALFEITQGASFFLNPRSAYGKEFYPQEISAILSTGTNHVPDRRVVQKETRVLLGQPKIYPSEMVGAITLLLAKHPNVKAAYLALMSQPDAAPMQSLVIGIEGDGDLEDAIRQVGSVAGDTRPREFPVDLVQVKSGESGLSEYFLNSTKPFYERSWGAKIKSSFGWWPA